MKTIDWARKRLVIAFICVGLGVGVYEHAATLPQHEGTGQGFVGDVNLLVTMDGDRIDSINVVSHSETEGISDPAFAEIIPSILKAQHLNIDDIAGATYTSRAIKEAVKEAVAKAGIELEILEVVKEEKSIERDGVVEGIGEGHKDKIVVKVERSGDRINNIRVISHGDTKSIAEPAFEKLTSLILESQSTDVDMVTGATGTSKGFIEAVDDALNEKK